MKLRGLNGLFLKNKDILSKSFFSLVAPISPSHIQDIDGNIYTYVTIGTQQWMVENLRTTHYADGTPIPNIIPDEDWVAEDGSIGHDGGYCWYNNDMATYKDAYGALYNYYACSNAHGLALTGWRVPSQNDFEVLVSFLGGLDVAGGKLKQFGVIYWLSPNTGATNEFGFTALPGGERNFETGAFELIRERGTFWEYPYDPFDPLNSDGFQFASYNDTILTRDALHYFPNGFSVRCMRDI